LIAILHSNDTYSDEETDGQPFIEICVTAVGANFEQHSEGSEVRELRLDEKDPIFSLRDGANVKTNTFDAS